MIELAAFVFFDGHTAGVVPYQDVMKSASEDGVKDELFPEGWQDQTEWVAAEVINEKTKDMYRVTLYIARDFEENSYDLSVFDAMFQHMAKDIIARFLAYNTVEFFNPDPHK